MLALDRKVLRDLWRMKWQFLAISLVIGCGVAVLIMAWSMLASLELTQQRYYEQFRFAHVFAHLKRAPNSLQGRIARIPGVATVETRIVAEVTLDLPTLAEPAIGRMISLPDHAEEGLNRIHLRAGRLPEPRRGEEAVVSEAFAAVHRLAPGDHIAAVLNGRLQKLSIVGVALSPEYVYQVRAGEVLPNERTFGVLWMNRKELANAFNIDGAFNDVALRLTANASEPRVIEHLDQLLNGYGGLGAYGRDLQASNRYITNELRELRNMGYFAPVIFLIVAAFLLNVVLSRLIGTQQVQIAALRAFGYSRAEIGWHYVKMTSAIVCVGALLGVVAGAYLGRGMTRMYSHFFHFPVLQFSLDPLVVLWSVAVSTLAAWLGIAFAVLKAVRLPPAVAMQPEPPATYRPALLERIGLASYVSPSTRMILRHLERRPLATSLTVLGIAFSIAVVVLGNYVGDAVNELLSFHFWRVQRYNISIGFTEPTESAVLHDLRQLPGVVEVEPMRAVVATFKAGPVTRRQEIMALPEEPKLFRLLDVHGRVQRVPRHGLLISSKLAELLHVKVGDDVEVVIQEGLRPIIRIPVQQLIDDVIGTSAYMHLDSLRQTLREGRTVSGAFLYVEPHCLPEIYRKLKETPRVASATSKLVALQSLQTTLAQTLLQMRAVNLAFAVIIACGVVYNSARITFDERSRDLASLRVLGYTRLEISYLLLGELGLITLSAIPLGIALGYALVVFISLGYDTELFRIPVIVYRSTYGLAVAVVLVAAAASALVVRRHLDRLDLVSVLKARD